MNRAEDKKTGPGQKWRVLGAVCSYRGCARHCWAELWPAGRLTPRHYAHKQQRTVVYWNLCVCGRTRALSDTSLQLGGAAVGGLRRGMAWAWACELSSFVFNCFFLSFHSFLCFSFPFLFFPFFLFFSFFFFFLPTRVAGDMGRRTKKFIDKNAPNTRTFRVRGEDRRRRRTETGGRSEGKKKTMIKQSGANGETINETACGFSRRRRKKEMD